MKKLSVIILPVCYINIAFGYVTTDVPNGCNTLNTVMYPIFEKSTYNCASGYYLPANATACVICPQNATCVGGTYTYDENITQGIEYNTFIPAETTGGCDGFYRAMYPLFEISNYHCSSGYYLPANADACVICPANSYCVGGTYTFNETLTQGIESCPTGYSSSAGAASCTANTITVNWGNEESESCSYGDELTVPATPPTRRGYTFVGWVFDNS